jgi:hypothetical protein
MAARDNKGRDTSMKIEAKPILLTKSISETKAETTNGQARRIIAAETEAWHAKTERLRLARLGLPADKAST